jgi:hypothetical protein
MEKRVESVLFHHVLLEILFRGKNTLLIVSVLTGEAMVFHGRSNNSQFYETRFPQKGWAIFLTTISPDD